MPFKEFGLNHLIIAAFSSLVTVLITHRRENKNDQLKYVTEERKEWRAKMRTLIVTFLTNSLHRDGDLLASPKIDELIKIKTEIAINLNPIDDEDEKIVGLMNIYIDLHKKSKTIDIENTRIKLERAFSKLLKHDWERVKLEAKSKPVISYWRLIYCIIFFTFIYGYLNTFPILSTKQFDINHLYIFSIILMLFVYLDFKINCLIGFYKKCILDTHSKNSFLSKTFRVVYREKID